MTKSYAVEVLKRERIHLLDQLDIMNSIEVDFISGKKREIIEQLNSVRESILTLEAEFVNMDEYTWNLAGVSGAMNEIINNKWNTMKESVESNEQEKEDHIHYHITINTPSCDKFDAAEFAMKLSKSLKRQRGIR